MTTIFLISIGSLIIDLVERLRGFVQLAIGITIGLVIVLLIIRLLTDAMKLNPFGRLYQYAHQPTNELFHRMRSSSFYYPLKRSLGFDPAILMILVGLAILWYVVTGVISNLFFVLQGFGRSLIAFGSGAVFTGVRYLVGVALIAVIFFLMALMTIVFVNWIFGLLRRPSLWAMERLSPLLRIFEFGGAFAGWSFIILWIALTFAAIAVQVVFFQPF
jgi:hypothetical protein